MKGVILITGNGLVAKRLSERLEEKKYFVRFLSRNKKGDNFFKWNLEKGYIDLGAFENVTHIIHLAGANVVSQRWSKKRKMEIFSSRVDSAQLILKILKKHNIKISSFVSASAVGYYGIKTTKNIYHEEIDKGKCFLSDLCDKWEKSADDFFIHQVSDRVVKLRIGIVFSKENGALNKILIPIKYYFGSVLGTGNQYVPWIHIDDLCDIIEYSIKNKEIKGVFNAVTENTTNKELIRLIARLINRPILLPNIPSFIVKLIFGEAGSLLTQGSRVSGNKIRTKGFIFKYPNITSALKNLIYDNNK